MKGLSFSTLGNVEDAEIKEVWDHFFFKEFPGLPLDNPQTTYFFSAKESQQGLNYL